jgi:hypothetical protein
VEVLVGCAEAELAGESCARLIREKNVECRADRPPSCKRALGAIEAERDRPGEGVPQCDLAVCS